MYEMIQLENAVFIKMEPDEDPAESGSVENLKAESTPPRNTNKDLDAVRVAQYHDTETENMLKSLRTFSVASVKEEVESDIEPDGKFTSEVFVGYSSESSDDIEYSQKTDVLKKCTLPADETIDRKKHKTKNKSKKKNKQINQSSPKSLKVVDKSVNLEKDKQQSTNKIMECCLCKKQFWSCKSLKKHIPEHGSHFRSRCLVCNRNFSELEKFQSHIEIHLQEKRFVCQVCGRMFRRGANLLRHEPTCGKEEPVPELCTQCGKLCQSKWQLQQHMMFHSDVRPYPCTYCSKSFRFKTRLAEHQRTHLGIKPHTCTICNKRFTTSSDMKKHQKRHQNPTFKGYNTENNPNKLSECRVCNEKVVNLKNHMYLHYDKGRGTCNVCGKILKTKSLYQHIKIHLEGAPFQCDVCNRTFNRKDNMLSHRERHARASYKPKVAIDNAPCQGYDQT